MGVWVSEAELQERVRVVRGRYELELSLVFNPSYLASGAGTQRPCPLCREPLAHCFLGDIEVDRCDQKHGIWFDAGELQTVLEAATQGVAVAGQDVAHGPGGRAPGTIGDVGAWEVAEGAGLLTDIAAFIAAVLD